MTYQNWCWVSMLLIEIMRYGFLHSVGWGLWFCLVPFFQYATSGHHTAAESLQMVIVEDNAKLLHNRVICHFFFSEATVNQASYLTMLEDFAYSQLAQEPGVIFQQDGAPPHRSLKRQWMIFRNLSGGSERLWVGSMWTCWRTHGENFVDG